MLPYIILTHKNPRWLPVQDRYTHVECTPVHICNLLSSFDVQGRRKDSSESDDSDSEYLIHFLLFSIYTDKDLTSLSELCKRTVCPQDIQSHLVQSLAKTLNF